MKSPAFALISAAVIALGFALSSCNSVSGSGPGSRPIIGVAIPGDLNERERYHIREVEDVLSRAGYTPVYAGGGYGQDVRYTLDFEIERVGPIKIYSYLALKQGDRIVTEAESSKSAVVRVFQGEEAYREVFEKSLAEFAQKMPPAEYYTGSERGYDSGYGSPYQGGGNPYGNYQRY
ncbi:MAG: hypothetical protein R3F11_27380 [Verrucomicrobiales bacterium]